MSLTRPTFTDDAPKSAPSRKRKQSAAPSGPVKKSKRPTKQTKKYSEHLAAKRLPRARAATENVGGFFGRLSQGDIGVIVTSKKDPVALPELKVEPIAPNSALISPIKTLQATPEESPGAPLRQRLAMGPMLKAYDLTVLRSPQGTLTSAHTKTPRRRLMVPAVQFELTKRMPDRTFRTILVEIVQTATSATGKNSTAKTPTEKKLEKTRQEAARPAARTYRIDKAPYTDQNMQATPRHYSQKEPAALLGAAFGKSMPRGGDRSHFAKNSWGERSAHAVLSEDDLSRGAAPDALISAAAPKDFNSMRCVTAEAPSLPAFVKFKGVLYYSLEATLFFDIKGPLPILENETSSWEDGDGNKIQFINSPWNHVVPDKEISKVTHASLKFLLGTPPKPPKPNDKKRSTVLGPTLPEIPLIPEILPTQIPPLEIDPLPSLLEQALPISTEVNRSGLFKPTSNLKDKSEAKAALTVFKLNTI